MEHEKKLVDYLLEKVSSLSSEAAQSKYAITFRVNAIYEAAKNLGNSGSHDTTVQASLTRTAFYWPDQDVQEAAFEALIKLNAEVGIFITYLGTFSNDEDIKLNALNILSEHNQELAHARVVELIKNEQSVDLRISLLEIIDADKSESSANDTTDQGASFAPHALKPAQETTLGVEQLHEVRCFDADREALSISINALYDDSPSTRLKSIHKLSDLAPSDDCALHVLVVSTLDHEGGNRLCALKEIAVVNKEVAFDLAACLLSDPDPMVQSEAERIIAS